jgi:5'-deoxynucleotidase YfbR-like HD superfamily hydrolase
LLEPVSAVHPVKDHGKGPTCIATLSGYIDLDNPSAADVHIVDIARSIAKLARFTGHTYRTLNVAEHSVTVLNIFDALYPDAEQGQRQYALLHDAHEAYCNDISSPMKRTLERETERIMNAVWRELCPFINRFERPDALTALSECTKTAVLKAIEGHLEEAVLTALKVPFPDEDTHRAVKRCDTIARYAEGIAVQGAETTWATSQREFEPLPADVQVCFGDTWQNSADLFLYTCSQVGLQV